MQGSIFPARFSLGLQALLLVQLRVLWVWSSARIRPWKLWSCSPSWSRAFLVVRFERGSRASWIFSGGTFLPRYPRILGALHREDKAGQGVRRGPGRVTVHHTARGGAERAAEAAPLFHIPVPCTKNSHIQVLTLLGETPTPIPGLCWARIPSMTPEHPHPSVQQHQRCQCSSKQCWQDESLRSSPG